MCGIAGYWTTQGGEASAMHRILGQMTGAIAHRGPDDSGTWVDSAAGIGLGHRRLAIIDLSPAGHQPMLSPSGRYVTTFNGEIYNYTALRADLEAVGAAPAWRGHSDTEVMVAGFEHWGIEATLARCNGMFALAVWDRRERVLLLARDRLGEKPLYYGRMGGSFLFASELRAIEAHPEFDGQIDRGAVGAFLRFGYVPAPHAIWHDIAKLPPANIVRITDGGRTVGAPQPYWRLEDVAKHGIAEPLTDVAAATDRLDVLLRDAVGLRMIADVGLGAFLSGGIDSSLIAALMQAQSAHPIKTFTIGFDDTRFDEAPHARAVANHLGTDHTELYVDAATTLDIVPQLPLIWDEPFGDSSQIPTFLVSRLARSAVTVSLSGDAGDELFGGYNRYLTAMQIADRASRVPAPFRSAIARLLSARATKQVAEAVNARLPTRLRHLGLSDRLGKVAMTIADPDPIAMYHRLVSHHADPASMLVHGEPYPGVLGIVSPSLGDHRAAMMYLDTLTYLPDDILTKVDRASMAVALEARVPFLDHRVVEFAWSLPMAAKIDRGVGKKILRDVLMRYVPRNLVERPKMGFAVPVATWLKGPLRDWAEALLDPTRLAEDGILDGNRVRAMWDNNLAGRGAYHTQLWDVLMLQAWREARANDGSPPALTVSSDLVDA
ncbi:asparagine synthase (glutamine-hydrolyzing) [Sphingomonas oligophenolica]|uniref:asparagine synthase (glutamine-hydrolyzing) n=1 Tax=Sphingomonas oligophenolica TaxID=301154 RepID=A0A502C5H6_9SPHN|nr:asparagine synthase (glutamine-hydrolyzing) [Sphingomonas oligophenolica]TPG08138.1 asparagine synthase (glutamine-hydrolyzing) [Sphingomonas oligophenolica]